MDSKVLIPHFTFDGDEVTVGDDVLTSDTTPYDFKAPVKITVKSGDQTKDYNVYMHAFTGIPVLWIETEGRAAITSKEDYINAHFKLVEDVKTRAAGDVTEFDGKIKGRGNSTWGMAKNHTPSNSTRSSLSLANPRISRGYCWQTMLTKHHLEHPQHFILVK